MGMASDLALASISASAAALLPMRPVTASAAASWSRVSMTSARMTVAAAGSASAASMSATSTSVESASTPPSARISSANARGSLPRTTDHRGRVTSCSRHHEMTWSQIAPAASQEPP
jgi:hypothetical protein